MISTGENGKCRRTRWILAFLQDIRRQSLVKNFHIVAGHVCWFFSQKKKRKEKEKEVGEGKECERRDLRKYGGKERLNDCRSSEVVVVVSKQWTRSDARANRS